MRISDALVEKLLTTTNSVSAEQLKSLREQEASEKKPLQDLVISSNIISEKDLTKLYAAEIDLPFVELTAKDFNHDVLRQIPERIARQYGVVLFGEQPDGSKLLAMEDPDDIQALNFLQKHLGNAIKVHVATHSAIQTALDQYRGNIGSELTKIMSPDETEEPDNEEEISEDDLTEDSP
ncbi:type II/IV secretion system protein, partial [Candidatus Saccharibacteria bacterium]|nr:type II/IV secretion system protein [Candidatus Saccharibacteria bacterium]